MAWYKPRLIDARQFRGADFKKLREWCPYLTFETSRKGNDRFYLTYTGKLERIREGDYLAYTKDGWEIFGPKTFHERFEFVQLDEP